MRFCALLFGLGSVLGLAATSTGCGKTPPARLLVSPPVDGGELEPTDGGPTDSGRFDLGRVDVGLPPEDAGPRDLGRPDADPPDLGPPDAGPPDMGPTTCDLGPLLIRVEVEPIGAQIGGVVRVGSVSPLRLEVAGGGEVTVRLSRDVPPPPVAVGARYQVFLQTSGSGDEAFLLMQTPDSSTFVFSAWSTSELPVDFFAFERAPCGFDPAGCGELDALTMVIEDGRGGEVRIRPGRRGDLFGFTIVNGRSFAYRGRPSCPQAPREFYEGAIIPRD